MNQSEDARTGIACRRVIRWHRREERADRSLLLALRRQGALHQSGIVVPMASAQVVEELRPGNMRDHHPWRVAEAMGENSGSGGQTAGSAGKDSRGSRYG